MTEDTNYGQGMIAIVLEATSMGERTSQCAGLCVSSRPKSYAHYSLVTLAVSRPAPLTSPRRLSAESLNSWPRTSRVTLSEPHGWSAQAWDIWVRSITFIAW